jgi:hypothetical protein
VVRQRMQLSTAILSPFVLDGSRCHIARRLTGCAFLTGAQGSDACIACAAGSYSNLTGGSPYESDSSLGRSLHLSSYHTV